MCFFAKFYIIESNPDIQEKYPYVRVGILEPMRNKDILTENSCFCHEA